MYNLKDNSLKVFKQRKQLIWNLTFHADTEGFMLRSTY